MWLGNCIQNGNNIECSIVTKQQAAGKAYTLRLPKSHLVFYVEFIHTKIKNSHGKSDDTRGKWNLNTISSPSMYWWLWSIKVKFQKKIKLSKCTFPVFVSTTVEICRRGRAKALR